MPGYRRWRASLYALMLVIGVGFASWVVRTPALRDTVHASTAQLGVIIAGLSLGSFAGIAAAARLVPRHGSRGVIASGAGLLVLGLALVALSAAVGAGWVTFLGLASYGGGLGTTEVGLNVEAAGLELRTGGSVLPAMHGNYSIGTFVGGLSGIALNALAVPVVPHLLVATVVVGAVGVWTVRGLPRLPPPPPPTHSSVNGSVWRERRVLLLCVVLLGMAMAEGSAGDWLPLIMVEGFGTTAVLGAVAYSVFGLAMSIGRFAGGRLVDRFGRVAVLRAGATLTAAGIAAVVLAPGLVTGWIGVALWGLGASLGFPLILSAAADDPHRAAARVSTVAVAGYTAFLVGPPVIGLIGEHTGLRDALLVVLALVCLAGAAAAAARPV